MKRAWSVLAALSAVSAAPAAFGASPNAATAEALFDEGRRLVHDGKTQEGCDKFAASQALDPALGTLLNLAACHAKVGRLATAWAEYRDARVWAERDGNAEREKLAARRVAELEPTLPKLSIELAPAAKIDGLTVTRDGTPLPLESLDTPLPADVGEHVVVVSAAGHVSRRLTATLPGPGALVTIRVAPLESEPSSVAPEPVPPAAAPESAPPRNHLAPAPARKAEKNDGLGTRRIAAITAGSVGAASLLVGAFFGVRALSRWGDAKDGCASPPTGCTHDAVALGQDANRDATIATVAVTIGVVGLGAGTWLWFGGGGTEPAHVVVGGRF